MTRTRTVLVTDLDNTLYDFAAFFSPSFRAMIHTLAPRLEIGEAELIQEFRCVFEHHGTLEYQFVVQEVASVRNRPANEIDKLIHAANVAFARTRRRRLRLYPNVKEILTRSHKAGIRICAATNAPIYQAYRRIRDLGLLNLFSVISSRDGTTIPNELGDHVRKYDSAMGELNEKMSYVSTHDPHHLKPNDELFRAIVDFWGRDEETAYFSVGDSVRKDLLPSHQLGMVTIWARYGTHIDQRDLETMLSVTPSSTLATLDGPMDALFKPDYTIDDFGELAEILPIQLALM